MLNQGLVTYHEEIVDYFKIRGVSAIFLFRRNLLRQMVSVLANNYDRNTKQLNGTHKAHVHSRDEAYVLARYKPRINATSLRPNLRNTRESTAKTLKYFKSTRHIVLYYEDLIQNHTKMVDVLDFLKVPRRKLVSRHVKIHTRPLSQQVQNWKDVYHALKGTRYENFLTADYKIFS
ncbi:putative Sulfotransferase [Cocos nucifera]|uniref:Putative Sulfotransferase n=1 Tax=Cocos nucifera TaxID=13894 RepID=A0A8K0HYS7_COCNU|nr:putative Sulfotransferase [Cocos nucifera]